MTRGLSRRQIGVTEEMIQAYGERVWELSTNVQIRRGDPVRLLEWDRIEAQRPDTGLSDAEIADWIGLTRDQVLYIRLAMERRRFHRNNYHRLFDLGGGRRYRKERFIAHEQRFGFSDQAMELRTALDFDPQLTAHWLRVGHWNGDTLARRFAARARQRPDNPMIVGSEHAVSNGAAYDAALRLANALLSLGIQRGDVVAVRLPDVPAFVMTYLAVALMGGVFCPLEAETSVGDIGPVIDMVHARALVCDLSEAVNLIGERSSLERVLIVGRSAPPGALSWEILAEGGQREEIDQPPVASDPAVLLADSVGATRRLIAHTHQTLLSNARALTTLYELGGADSVLVTAPLSSSLGLAAMNMALQAGAAVRLTPEKTSEEIAAALAADRPTVMVADTVSLDVARIETWTLDSVRKIGLAGPSQGGAIANSLRRAMPDGVIARCWSGSECLTALHAPFETSEMSPAESVGQPLPGIEVRVVSKSGHRAPANVEGMVEIRGASIGIAAWDAEKAPSRNGWLRMGIRATIDRQGNVVPVEQSAS